MAVISVHKCRLVAEFGLRHFYFSKVFRSCIDSVQTMDIWPVVLVRWTPTFSKYYFHRILSAPILYRQIAVSFSSLCEIGLLLSEDFSPTLFVFGDLMWRDSPQVCQPCVLFLLTFCVWRLHRRSISSHSFVLASNHSFSWILSFLWWVWMVSWSVKLVLQWLWGSSFFLACTKFYNCIDRRTASKAVPWPPSVSERTFTRFNKNLEIFDLYSFQSQLTVMRAYRAVGHLVRRGSIIEIKFARLQGRDEVSAAHQSSERGVCRVLNSILV